MFLYRYRNNRTVAYWLTEMGRVFKPSEERRKKGDKAFSSVEVTNLETGEFIKLR